MKKKFLAALTFFIIGILSLAANEAFYGFVGPENNVVQDSLFLPLGALFVSLAALIFTFSLLRFCLSKIKQTIQK